VVFVSIHASLTSAWPRRHVEKPCWWYQ